MKRRFLWISEHASPLALLGGADGAGQNVYVDRVARRLATAGYGADPSRIATVPCGFDSSEFRPADKAGARAKLGLEPGEPIVLQLGRMVPRKGVDNVIRGLARLRRHRGIPARLIVVGGESRDP